MKEADQRRFTAFNDEGSPRRIPRTLDPPSSQKGWVRPDIVCELPRSVHLMLVERHAGGAGLLVCHVSDIARELG